MSHPQSPSPPPRLANVLLVDDNESDNFFHKQAIEASELVDTVDVATTAHQALTRIRSSPTLPDLILLDIRMPEMDGWAFLNQLQRLRPTTLPAVVLMVAFLPPPTYFENEAMWPYVRACIKKPITSYSFRELIHTCFCG
ncbi:MAG: response regulator [Myxococcales bacterium]|nr:response regulator [Myxococcales bacterium]